MNLHFSKNLLRFLKLVFLNLSTVSFLFLAVQADGAEFQKNCKEGVLGQWNLSYCITKDPDSRNPDLLYYFHGLLGNQHSWDNDGAEIRENWSKLNIDPPTVVSISAGPAWLLSEPNGQPTSGTLDQLVNRVIPDIETSLGGLKGKRHLLGISMGGFNAIQLMMVRPNWFNKVALVSPAITTISPFSSPQTIWEYIQRTGAQIREVGAALAIGIIHFPTNYHWEMANPLQLVKKMNATFPEVYLGTSYSDCYGFQEGDLAFADQAIKQGVPLKKHTYAGAHAQIKSEEIVKFFASNQDQ